MTKNQGQNLEDNREYRDYLQDIDEVPKRHKSSWKGWITRPSRMTTKRGMQP